MRYLRYNTATRVTVGPFIDQADGITPEVALTVTSEHLTLMVDTGGVPTLVLDVAPTASGGANDMVHVTGDDAGFYDLELAAANVNYLGRAMLSINNVAAHCPVFHEFTILPQNIYDSMILGTDLFDVSLVQVNGAAQTATLDTIKAETALIVADTDELQTDDVPGLIATAQADLDTITGADGVNLLTATQASIDAIEADAAASLTGITLNTLIISPVGGTTDSTGDAGGTTVLDSTRSEATGHWNNLAIEITSGACLGQLRPIELYTQSVGFTVPASRPFTAQIVSGVTYRIVSAVIAQPGITVTKNNQATVEPDTSLNLGVSLITANGEPGTGDITPGTISIYRIRAGAQLLIVDAAACSEGAGNIYYTYTFPSASWAAGDSYLAVMVDQSVIVNGTDYPLSAISLQGWVTRETAIKGDTASILDDTGTSGVLLADGAVTAAKIATDAIGSDEIAAAGANKVADHIIRRTFQNACDSADGDAKTGRSLLGAIAKLVNKLAASGGTLTVYEDDDVTALFTQAITTNASADPVTELDTT